MEKIQAGLLTFLKAGGRSSELLLRILLCAKMEAKFLSEHKFYEFYGCIPLCLSFESDS